MADPLALLAAEGMSNVDALTASALAARVPLWLAAALMEKESGGRNVYGNDRTAAGRLGVYAVGDPERPEPNVVTEANFARFEARVLAGELSNGTGPAQITHPDFIAAAKAEGIRLWVPLENMTFGLRLLASYLAGELTDDAIRRAGTRYNGAAAYGDDLVLRARSWRALLEGAQMALPRNTGTPAGIAALERAIRTQRPEWDVTCGPSMAGTKCVRGKHGHRWSVDASGRVTDWSTHYVDANGGPTGRHVGGALDLSQDPRPGVPISTYEKARADDLVAELDRLGYGCIWGVAQHFDHPHIDYRRANRNIVWQGPNYPFTVAEVLATQRKLARLSRYSGAMDGLREKLTRDAIEAFQKARGLRVDGDPGPLTQAALDRDLAKLEAPPAPAPVPAAPEPPAVPSSRLRGANRYATAAAISRRRFPKGAAVAYLAATGTDDAGLATFTDGPTLLVGSGSTALRTETITELRRLNPTRVIAVGGEGSVTAAAVRAAARAAAQ